MLATSSPPALLTALTPSPHPPLAAGSVRQGALKKHSMLAQELVVERGEGSMASPLPLTQEEPGTVEHR